MTPAPYLAERDLKEELADIHRKRHRTRTTALYGSGDAGRVEVEIQGEKCVFAVRPVTCELELRRELVNPTEGSGLVLLVDFTRDLPLDIAGRVAGGKVFSVTRARRLARLFGAAQAAPDLVQSPLTDALLAIRSEGFAQIRAATLDADTAWRAFLTRSIGFPHSEAGLTDLLILGFCARNSGRELWEKAVNGHAGLAVAFEEHLSNQPDLQVALWAWRIWLRGQGHVAAALAFILDGVGPERRSEPLFRSNLRMRLDAAHPDLWPALEKSPALLERWAKLARPLHLKLGAEPAVQQLVIAEADKFFAGSELAPLAVESAFLPSALDGVRDELAKALTNASAGENVDAAQFARAAALLAKLGCHVFADNHRELIEKVRMAMRLMAYRAWRPNFEEQFAPAAADEPVFALAEHYVREGGFLDFARQRARTSGSDPLARVIGNEVTRIAALRDADDRRFAEALPSWLASGRSAASNRVVPIEKALGTFVAEFLAENDRLALVILMDGMAWANAVELLLDLERLHIAPLAWRGKRAQFPRAIVPMLAALPTVTEVSRAAFFSGKLPAASEVGNTGRDPDRFAAHTGLAKVLEGTVPKLLLRSDATTPDGQASPAALELVRSEKDRLVAVVVNAVDESLKSGRQIGVSTTADSIKPLAALLQAATEAGRAVFMAADHGHVSGDRLESSSAPNAQGGRWRPLKSGEAALAHEIALGGDMVHVPRGADRIACIASETVSYSKTQTLGEHGGATLAEVVAPAFFIGHESLADIADRGGHGRDRELETVPFQRPQWWDLELPKARSGSQKPKAATQTALPLQSPSLPSSPKPAVTTPAKLPAPLAKPAADSLVRKALLKAKVQEHNEEKREKLIQRVETLVTNGFQMAPAAFANQVGVFERNVWGVVAEMAESLNIDGYPVIIGDQAQKVIRLDKALLAELFGVKL